MNLKEEIKNHLRLAGDGLLIAELKAATRQLGGVIMNQLGEMGGEVEQGVDGRWYLTEKSEPASVEIAPVEVQAVVEVIADPIEATAVLESNTTEIKSDELFPWFTGLKAKNAYHKKALNKPTRLERFRLFLHGEQTLGNGPFTPEELTLLGIKWNNGQRLSRDTQRAIVAMIKSGGDDLLLLSAMVCGYESFVSAPESNDGDMTYDPLDDLNRDLNELRVRVAELSHIPEAKTWAALCVGLHDVFNDLNTPLNMIQINLMRMADFFSSRVPLEQR